MTGRRQNVRYWVSLLAEAFAASVVANVLLDLVWHDPIISPASALWIAGGMVFWFWLTFRDGEGEN